MESWDGLLGGGIVGAIVLGSYKVIEKLSGHSRREGDGFGPRDRELLTRLVVSAEQQTRILERIAGKAGL